MPSLVSLQTELEEVVLVGVVMGAIHSELSSFSGSFGELDEEKWITVACKYNEAMVRLNALLGKKFAQAQANKLEERWHLLGEEVKEMYESNVDEDFIPPTKQRVQIWDNFVNRNHILTKKFNNFKLVCDAEKESYSSLLRNLHLF